MNVMYKLDVHFGLFAVECKACLAVIFASSYIPTILIVDLP